jgi:hypothetical protein
VTKVCLLFAAAYGACTYLIAPPAFGQAALPDFKFNYMNDVSPPKPNGQIYGSLAYSGLTTAVTVDVVAYRGSAAAGNGVEILRKPITFVPGSVPVFDSGQTIPFTEGEIYSLCINPGHTVAESNFNNNCLERVVSAAYTDLSINVSDISVNPVGPSVGQPATVTAAIRNKYNVTARTLVRLFQGHPNSPGAKVLGQNTVSVPANASGVASFTITRPAGDSNFWVVLEDVYPRDINFADNLTSRNVYLKAIINTGRTSPGSPLVVPYASSPAVGDLLGNGQPVMVFAEYVGVTTPNEEARITAVQVFSDGTYKELWSKSGFLPSRAQALDPSIADIDGDGQPEVIFEAVHWDGASGQMGIFVLNKDGSLKWQHVWDTVGRPPCHNFSGDSRPVLGDMNRDGNADIAVLELDLVVMDGRNGNELVRKPGIKVGGTNPVCSSMSYSAIADVDGDGKNEYIASGDYGTHVFNNDGTLRWENTVYGSVAFALIDTDKDGKPEIVLPIHRSLFNVLDASTGAIKRQNKPSPDWGASGSTIAATTSIDPNGYPSFAIANNDFKNGTGLLDNNLNLKWYNLVPPAAAGTLDNPSYVVLADLLGQGRPQVISHSNYRNLGIQDIATGEWLEYFSITGGFLGRDAWPIPVDVDGDGRGEIIVNYSLPWTYDGSYEPRYPAADFLVFGSDQWKKIPSTWNQHFFVPNQVDQKLAFKHDYQPWKTHNTWMQQPLRKPCDVDFDDDVDQNDINAITSARGQTVPAGDWRDYDKDRLITVNDARACTQLCTLGNCAVINATGHILSVSPRRAFPGSTLNVTIRAEFLKFKTGAVTVDLGAGVTVSNVVVIDADTLTATVTVAPGQSGDRNVTITSSGVSVSRPSAFSLSAGNVPPVVRAGSDQTLVLPGTITVSGTVSDDGLPYNQLSYSWQIVAAPGQVTITNPTSLTTSVAFSREGFYVLRLSASDGQYFSNDDIGVVVIQGNQAPIVNAGQPMTVTQDAPVITLKGDVQDDGLPYGSKATSQWSKVSGPGNVTFGAPNSAVTNVAFSAPGVYVLSLSASDTQLSASATVNITVNPPTPRILSVSPDSAAPGQTRTVTLVTRFTHFVQGTTQANFGPGVSVGGAAAGTLGPVTVVDATTATAQVVVSTDAPLGARTITVATGTEQASKDKAFTVGNIGVPFAVRPNLDYLAISPGESINANPQVVDAAGNVISLPAGFTMTVTPKPGLAMGNAPVVAGLTASFPKLNKRLLNQNLEVDPEGEFADGDPTDPNYGKETGGIYTVEITLNGTAVKGSIDLVVLPSGTARIALGVLRSATELDAALAAALQAVRSRDTTAISTAKGALTAISQNVDYSPKILVSNNVLAPVNGFPVTYARVAARFSPVPDDATYGRSLDAISQQVKLLRTRIDSITVASLSQADLDALAAGAATYKSMVDQLGALKPGPVGVTLATDQINNLLGGELPLLIDSITRKTAELLSSLPAGTATLKDASTFRAVSGDTVWSFFSTLFSIITGLESYAKANIIEVAVSLANDLVNIAIANEINRNGNGDMAVDFIAAGGQFSYVCPKWQNTYVEGAGFSPEVKKNSVALIGCVNSNLIRNLFTLKAANDLAAAIRLFSKIKSIAEALSEGFGFAATVQPDSLREGLFGGTDLVFNEGWPRVNQGRIPCVGVVIVFNFDSGAMQALNVNMLPSCQ